MLGQVWSRKKNLKEEITSERESTEAHHYSVKYIWERARYLFALYVDFKYIYAAILKYSWMQVILNIK